MGRKPIVNSELGRRLTQVREAAGFKTRKELAATLEMNAETLGGYERGTSIPDHAFLKLYKDKFGISIDWLVTGEGEMSLSDVPRSPWEPLLAQDRAMYERAMRAVTGTGVLGPVATGPSGFIHLPLFDIHASAGLGMPVGPEVQLGALALDRAFLRAQGANPENCSIIAASGDSMEPSIPNGALLVVDHGQTEIRHGHIMVVNVGEDLLVKRIRRRLDGLVELISDNPAYPPETVGRDMIDQLRIVGR
ncbi:S24 family peptidase, partial [Rhodovulum strictum]|nr:transcriptional regulator [Rhodovulum strictum]